jgi:hypothetical protein
MACAHALNWKRCGAKYAREPVKRLARVDGEVVILKDCETMKSQKRIADIDVRRFSLGSVGIIS